MIFTISGHKYEVTAQGRDCVVVAERGIFRHQKTLGRKPDEDDIPTMFFTAMAGTYEGEAFPDYQTWLNYICENDSKKNRQIHARYVLQAQQWHEVSDVTADEVLNFLSENYEI